jgi:uncharacterized membrane protein YfcA
MPEIASLLPMAALLLVIGAFSGVVAGLLGVGGGIVLVPAFFYAFSHLGYGGDQLMQVCLATSLATIIVTSVRSVRAHHRKGAVDWDMLRAWAPFIIAGAVAGAATATLLRSATLQALFGGLAMLAGLYMAFGRETWRLGPALPGQPMRGVMASTLGFFSVLMGIGGGTFGVPLMTLYSTPIHRAVATASGLGVVIAVPSVAGFLLMQVEDAPPWTVGAVNLPALILVVATSLFTTPWGADLAHRMNARPLKRAFAVFLVLVALNMLRKVVGW